MDSKFGTRMDTLLNWITFYKTLPYVTIFIFIFVFVVSVVMNIPRINLFSPQIDKQSVNVLLWSLLQLNLVLVVVKFVLTYRFSFLWLEVQFRHGIPTLSTRGFYGFFDNIYNNLFGDGLLILCYITSIVCLWCLGERGAYSMHATIPYFSFFIICTTIMTTTSNLLIMFISFELIFFPSIFFVYTLGYAKKTDRTILILLFWTLLGAFIVLFAFSWLYSITGTFDIKAIVLGSLSVTEHKLLYLLFFVGFGIKLPIFPFHYWLTKVHVEAPAGFSIFLSGFLVKTALYCFYFINLIFSTAGMQAVLLVWVTLGIIESSLKMWTQTDIKKLIAFATIQEMNMLLLCLLLVDAINLHIVITFMLLHGVLSALMFLIVDLVQKRSGTRDILELQGALISCPWLRLFSWCMLIQYLGLPLTVKFLVEWYVGALVITTMGFYGCFVFFIAVFFGAVGFFKCWALILFGTSEPEQPELTDLTSTEILFIIFLLFILTWLCICTAIYNMC